MLLRRGARGMSFAMLAVACRQVRTHQVNFFFPLGCRLPELLKVFLYQLPRSLRLTAFLIDFPHNRRGRASAVAAVSSRAPCSKPPASSLGR
jgi:hypothetical protein